MSVWPALLKPVTVYVAIRVGDVGVPLIAPEMAIVPNPGGKSGATEYVSMAPPLLEGVFGVMGNPTV